MFQFTYLCSTSGGDIQLGPIFSGSILKSQYEERCMRTHEMVILRHDSSVTSSRHVIWIEKTSMPRTYAKASTTGKIVVKILYANSIINNSNLDWFDHLADLSARGHGIVCLSFKDRLSEVCHALGPLVLGSMLCDLFSASEGLVS